MPKKKRTITTEDALRMLKNMNANGGGSGGAVASVNGKTGKVVLSAEDVGALPNTTEIPSGLLYGVCSSAANAKNKEVSIEGFTLKEGVAILVKFTASNSIYSPTLNVNGTGAKPICKSGTIGVSSGSDNGWASGAVILLVYDGTNWIRDYWTNTVATNVLLGNGYATCSTEETTTAKVVTLSGYSLVSGGIVVINFTNAVPAASTLNVNNKGAKSIYFRGEAITDGVIKAGDTASFMYNNSYYHLLSIDRWQNDINAKVDKSSISLGIASDGLMYVFIDGNPVGTGLSQGQSADIYGYVDENNTVVLSGSLAGGTYTLKYENADGTTTEIGTFTLGEGEIATYTNLFNPATASINTRYSNSSGTINNSATGYVLTDYIPVTIPSGSEKKLYIKGASLKTANSTVLYFISSKQFNQLTNAGTMGVGVGTANGWSNVYTDENGNEYIKLGYCNATQNDSSSEIFDANLTDTAYIRVQFQLSSGSITADDIKDIIITIDEPITD